MILLMPLLVATLIVGTPAPPHAASGASIPSPASVSTLMELRCAP